MRNIAIALLTFASLICSCNTGNYYEVKTPCVITELESVDYPDGTSRLDKTYHYKTECGFSYPSRRPLNVGDTVWAIHVYPDTTKCK